MPDSTVARQELSHLDSAEFTKRLEALHEISLELSGLADRDEICRRAIELGKSRLGVDRMGIWFIDEEERGYVVGSYGVDESGNIRDERGVRHRIEDNEFLASFLKEKKSHLHQDAVPVRDQYKRDVGWGAKDSISMWDGDICLGYISFDNFVSKYVDTPHDRDIKILFGRVIGNCVAIKRSERNLRAALGEKQMLLHEVNHRVKNNMQVVLSLMSLEFGGAPDDGCLKHLRAMETRISALLSLQAPFHETMRADGAEIAKVIDYIFKTVRSAFLDDQGRLGLKAIIGVPSMGIEKALGLGLLFNEFFVLCAVFAREKALAQELSVSVLPGEGGFAEARIASSAPVFEAGDSVEDAAVSMKILEALALQTGAGLQVEAGGNEAHIRFCPAPVPG
jgi:two-component sensor histidine kinase